MGNVGGQDDEFIVPDFVQNAMIADAEPSQPPQAALQRCAEMGVSASRSTAPTIRVRSALATRLSSWAALSLIRLEKVTPDADPVQHRIQQSCGHLLGHGDSEAD